MSTVVDLLAILGAGFLVILVLFVPLGWLDARRRERQARKRREQRPGFVRFASKRDG